MELNTDGLTIDVVPSGRNGQVTLTARLAGEAVACESLNLTKAKARGNFIARLCEGRPGIDAKVVEAELLRLAADLANRPEPAAPEADTRPDNEALLQAMPEPVRAEARAMLESPKLLQQVVGDIAALGVAGERELAATVYLIGTSRLLPAPLASIVQGPTASGKSYVIRQVAGLFPPEAVILATQLTAQALFYMQPGALSHRFVVVGERRRAQDDEAADATRALREMLSEGRLSKMLPVKVDGQLQTVLIEQEGPIAYCESTTAHRLFAEDANRCILLTTDERPEQTRRIIAKSAAVASGAGLDAQGIIDKHHALQRMLRPFPVVVPFAEPLGDAIDERRVEARRAFPQLLSMVRASALLHQRQRQVDEQGRLLADRDDYKLARHLLAGPMARQLRGRVSDAALRLLDRLRGWFGAGTFAKPEVLAKENVAQTTLYEWLGELARASLIAVAESRAGNRPARWQVSADAGEGQTVAVLPPVEQVFLPIPAGSPETAENALQL